MDSQRADEPGEMGVLQGVRGRPAHEARARIMALDSLAAAAHTRREYSEVIRLLDEIETLPPELVPASIYCNRGTAYAMLGQFEKALKPAEHAVQMSPDCAIHHAALALVLENLSRYNEAQTAWRRALRLDPSVDEVGGYQRFVINRIRELLTEAKASLKQKDYREGIQLTTQAIGVGTATDCERQIQQLMGEAYNDRASAYLYSSIYGSSSHLREAIEDADRAVELRPDCAVCHLTRGYVLIESRHFDEARGQLKRALELDASIDGPEQALWQIDSEELLQALQDAVRTKQATTLLPVLDAFYGRYAPSMLPITLPCMARKTSLFGFLALKLMKQYAKVPPVLAHSCWLLSHASLKSREELVQAGAIDAILGALHSSYSSGLEEGHRWGMDKRQCGPAQVMSQGLDALRNLCNPLKYEPYDGVIKAAANSLAEIIDAMDRATGYVCLPGLRHAAWLIVDLCRVSGSSRPPPPPPPPCPPPRL